MDEVQPSHVSNKSENEDRNRNASGLTNYAVRYGDSPAIQSGNEAIFDAQLNTIRLKIAEEIGKSSTGTLIDIGCGMGALLVTLSEVPVFVGSDWRYIGVDSPDNLLAVNRLAQSLKLGPRVILISIEEFYATWLNAHNLDKPNFAVVRNVIHELSIEETATLVYFLSSKLEYDEILLVQDLVVFPEAERGFACWIPDNLKNILDQAGFKCVLQPERSRRGNRWCNIAATRNAASSPSRSSVLQIVISERRHQLKQWDIQGSLVDGDIEARTKQLALQDFDLQYLALVKQLKAFPINKKKRSIKKQSSSQVALKVEINSPPDGPNDNGPQGVCLRTARQTAGALPGNSPLYISRPTDDELLQLVESSKFISIFGGFQIGKSSLLAHSRLMLSQDWSVIIKDASMMRLDNGPIFMTEFFRLVSRQLGLVDTWDSLNDKLGEQKLLVMLDEVGAMTPEVAELLVPPSYNISQNTAGRLQFIVTSPNGFPLDKTLAHPKHRNYWHQLRLRPFGPVEIGQLINKSLFSVQSALNEHIEEILAISGGNPAKIQCLLSVVDEMADSIPQLSDIRSIVLDLRNYDK